MIVASGNVISKIIIRFKLFRVQSKVLTPISNSIIIKCWLEKNQSAMNNNKFLTTELVLNRD